MRKWIRKLLIKFSWFFNRVPWNNSIKMGGGKITLSKGLLFRCKIRCKGKGNQIILHKNTLLKKCTIHVYGDNNVIELSEGVLIHQGDICMENDGNLIKIEKNTHLCGKIHLACIEGTKIEIGENSLFSSDIVFRTGDSHSILNREGERINPSKDIRIGNHVWIGHRVLVGKGVVIGDDNMIGTGSVVTKSIVETNNVIAGVPAKIVKKDTNWDTRRL